MITFEQKKLADGSVTVTLRGKIDADFDGNAIRAAATGPRLLMHLAEVHGLTSLGVFAFTRFIDSLGDCKIELLHVSAVIARQLTILPDLFARVHVESARLPFACPSCAAEAEHSIPFRTGADLLHAPACECGALMELDGLPEQYLPSE